MCELCLLKCFIAGGMAISGGMLCHDTSLYKLKCFIAGGMAMSGVCVVSWHFSIQTEVFYCWRYGYVWGVCCVMALLYTN